MNFLKTFFSSKSETARWLIVVAIMMQILWAITYAPQYGREMATILDPFVSRSFHNTWEGKMWLNITDSRETATHVEPMLHKERLNTAFGDSMHYFAMAMGKSGAVEPYSLRPLIPGALGYYANNFAGCDPTHYYDLCRFISISKMNHIMTSLALLAMFIFTYLAMKPFIKDELVLGLFSLINIINVGVIQAAPFFMLDVYSYLIFTMAGYFWLRQMPLALCITTCIGVAVKEIAIILAILQLAIFLKGDRTASRFFYLGFLGLMPLFIFIGIRNWIGVDPLSVQYGWNVSEFEIKSDYWDKHTENLWIFFLKVLPGFGIALPLLLFSLIFSRKKLEVGFAGIVIALIILADMLLASRVARVVQVGLPIAMFAGVAYLAPALERYKDMFKKTS